MDALRRLVKRGPIVVVGKRSEVFEVVGLSVGCDKTALAVLRLLAELTPMVTRTSPRGHTWRLDTTAIHDEAGHVPWAVDGMDISPKSLNSRILCERHNNVLSTIDTVAAQLFSMLVDFRHDRHEGDLLLAGEDIERWILKVLVGMLNAGVVTRFDGVNTRGACPPLSTLQILFGERSIHDGWKLWLSLDPSGDAKAFQFRPNCYPPGDRQAGKVWGARLNSWESTSHSH